MEVNKLDQLVRQYFDPDKLPQKAYQLFLEDMASRSRPPIPLIEAKRVDIPSPVYLGVHGLRKNIPTTKYVTYTGGKSSNRWAFTREATALTVTVLHVPGEEVETRYNQQDGTVTYLHGTEGGRRVIFPKINIQGRLISYDNVNMPPGRYYLVSQGEDSLTFKHESKY